MRVLHRRYGASAKAAGEDYENAEYVHTLALKFRTRISDHFCEDEEDEEVDCNCGCQRNQPVALMRATTLQSTSIVHNSCLTGCILR